MNNNCAKAIAAILTPDTKLREKTLPIMEGHLGKADFAGGWHTFDFTSYYEEEMGPNLVRSILSFEKPFQPHEMAKLKEMTINIENSFRINGKRTINIDPGYIDHCKVVLASAKGGGHMIKISDNIWVDFLLYYDKGWKPLPWTYPDFKSGVYFDELSEIKKRLKRIL